jgi:carbon-monoxide dehydrogenase medium subunit
MKPAAFTYHCPSSVDEALRLLGSHDNARLLAGGQSLVPMLNFRLASPDHLIDLNRIPALRGIREEGDAVVFGAMTRQRDIEFSPVVAARLPLMAEAVLQLGHRQTRNRGTIGGSLCHLDPSAELPTICMAMDAALDVAGPAGTRTLSMGDFAQGMMTTALEAGDMLTAIRIRPWTGRVGHAFIEFARRHGDFAVASSAVLIELDAASVIRRASVTLGGVCPVPLRVTAAEAALVGAKAGPEAFAAAAAACEKVDALEDPTYPAWYRQHLAKTLTGRALALAGKRAAGR